ncbi:hypothetical protein DRQ18_01135 [bacterium]|nr:MAG: hypothetical protein DRQ18_01135 [bacterium]
MRWLWVILLCVVLFFIEKEAFEHLPGKGKEELLYFPRRKFASFVSSGYENLWADFVWLKCIQYYGKHRFSDRDFRYLYHILDVLTTIDHRFIPGYTFGAFLLSHDAREVENAISLLKKGMWANPELWQIPFVLGFVHYLYTKNYHEAARYFYLTARYPNSYPHASVLASYCMVKEKRPEVGIKVWSSLYEKTRNRYMREKCVEGIEKILTSLLREFEKKEGRLPKTLGELGVEIPYLEGVRFFIDRKERKVKAEVPW